MLLVVIIFTAHECQVKCFVKHNILFFTINDKVIYIKRCINSTYTEKKKPYIFTYMTLSVYSDHKIFNFGSIIFLLIHSLHLFSHAIIKMFLRDLLTVIQSVGANSLMASAPAYSTIALQVSRVRVLVRRPLPIPPPRTPNLCPIKNCCILIKKAKTPKIDLKKLSYKEPHALDPVWKKTMQCTDVRKWCALKTVIKKL